MRCIILSALLLTAAGLPAQTSRPQVFVDAVSGSNATGNGTQQAPYQTITHALSQVTTPVTINVAAGTYDAALGEMFPLVVGPGIDVIGAGGMSSIVTGTGAGTPTLVSFEGTVFSPPDGISRMGLTNSSSGLAIGVSVVASTGHVIVDNCRIAGHVSAGLGISSITCMVKNSTIVNNQNHGIGIGGSAVVQLIANDISGNGGRGVNSVALGQLQAMIENTISSNLHGADLRGFATTGSRIERNIITNNAATGLLVNLPVNVPPPDVLIAGNLIANNATDGIRVESNNHPIRFLNNTIVDNGGYGLIVHSLGFSGFPPPIQAEVYNNIVTGNTLGSVVAATPSPLVPAGLIVGSNNLFDCTSNCGPGIPGPPQFVDPAGGDYHLLPTSPAVDASTLLNAGIPLFDLDGNIRSFDGDADGDPLPDLGAFEVLVPNLSGLRPLGHGCADPLGRPVLSGSGGFPIPGNLTFGLQITGAPQSTFGWLQMATTLGPVNLGALNCVVWLDPLSFVFPGLGLPIGLDASGTAQIPLAIPVTPALSGLQAFFQAVAVVPGQPFAVLSNALEVVVQ